MALTEIEAIVAALRAHDRFLVTTHENPDGDALGSLLATHLALEQLGKSSVMVMGGLAPLPGEYGFLQLDAHGLVREVPADAAERVLVAVDCAQASRIADPQLVTTAPLTLNIDHHHDNSRFGDANFVVADASSTGELLAEIFVELGMELTPSIAEALYTALVTDTGRFQYSNTTPKALRLAAQLIESGADVSRVFGEVFESLPFAKLKLLARALERATLYADGRVVVSELVRGDFEDAGAEEPFSEGVIDQLRSVEGAELVALVRELPRGEGSARKGSLRSTSDEIDVSAIARTFGGGGHRRAAGFSTDLPLDAITLRIVEAYGAAAGAPMAE